MVDKKTILEEIIDLINDLLAKNDLSLTDERKAPAYAHQMLDAMLTAKAAEDSTDDKFQAKAAPDAAHSLLDLIWDLLVK